MTHTASCSCGQLTLSFDGERPPGSFCHCLECQKRTGSAYGLQCRLAASRATIVGESCVWERVGDGGAHITFHFCATCAATLYWELDMLPDDIIVAIGAFADPTWPSPTFSVYEDRAHSWWARPDCVTRFMG